MSGAGGTTTARLLIHASSDVPVDTPRVPAREAAKHELSHPMYHENDPNLLQRGLDRFWGWLGDLFATASNAAPGGPLGLIVLVLVVLGLAVALWWRLGTPQRTPAPRTHSSTTAPEARPNTALPPRPTLTPSAGTRPSRNACAPSCAPWKNAPSSTHVPAARPTRPPPRRAAPCPATGQRFAPPLATSTTSHTAAGPPTSRRI